MLNVSPTTPAGIFRAALASLQRGDVNGWMELCAEDVVFEFPFAPPGRPRRLEGRAAVATYLSALPGTVQVEQEPLVSVHESVDPGTVIIEMQISGRVTATGAPFTQGYVVVMTVVDGLITGYRDYWNPLVALEMHTPA